LLQFIMYNLFWNHPKDHFFIHGFYFIISVPSGKFLLWSIRRCWNRTSGPDNVNSSIPFFPFTFNLCLTLTLLKAYVLDRVTVIIIVLLHCLKKVVRIQNRHVVRIIGMLDSEIVEWVFCSGSMEGHLKGVLATETGLEPKEQRLLVRGKEKEDEEWLHMVGVKDMSKVVLLEDPASKEKKLEEMQKSEDTLKAWEAISTVRTEVDKLHKKVLFLVVKTEKLHWNFENNGSNVWWFLGGCFGDNCFWWYKGWRQRVCNLDRTTNGSIA